MHHSLIATQDRGTRELSSTALSARVVLDRLFADAGVRAVLAEIPKLDRHTGQYGFWCLGTVAMMHVSCPGGFFADVKRHSGQTMTPNQFDIYIGASLSQQTRCTWDEAIAHIRERFNGQ